MNNIKILKINKTTIASAFMIKIGSDKVLGFIEKFHDTRSTKNPWRIYGAMVTTNEEGTQGFRYNNNVFYTTYGSKNDAVNMMFEKNLVPVSLG